MARRVLKTRTPSPTENDPGDNDSRVEESNDENVVDVENTDNETNSNVDEGSDEDVSSDEEESEGDESNETAESSEEDDEDDSDVESVEDNLVLPPSSRDLDIQSVVLLPDSLAVYEIIRKFYKLIRISPFTFEDFLACLQFNEPTTLLSEIHISLVKCIFSIDEKSGTWYAISDQRDLIGLIIHCMDVMTWPYVTNLFVSAFPVNEFVKAKEITSCNAFPFVPFGDRLVVLRALTDMLIQSAFVRDAINVTISITNGAVVDSQIRYEDSCRRCGKSGQLLCCERCPAVYHLFCVHPPLQNAPDDEWICSVCRDNEVPGVTDLIGDETVNANRLALRESLGVDRHGRKYYFAGRRLVIHDVGLSADALEQDANVWYYTSPSSLDVLLSKLNRRCRAEKLLTRAIEEKKQIIVNHMTRTMQITKASMTKQQSATPGITFQAVVEQDESMFAQMLQEDGDAMDVDTALPIVDYSDPKNANLFALGTHRSFLSYKNQYSANPLALTRQQHIEERDKRRSLAKHFSVYVPPLVAGQTSSVDTSDQSFVGLAKSMTNAEFSWSTSSGGDLFDTFPRRLNAVVQKLSYIEKCLPYYFCHTAWPAHRVTFWQPTLPSIKRCSALGLAMLLFQAYVKPVALRQAWHSSPGVLSLRRLSVGDRDVLANRNKAVRKPGNEVSKSGGKRKSHAQPSASGHSVNTQVVGKPKNSSPYNDPSVQRMLQDDPSLVLTKTSFPIKHSVYRQKGEEYRLFAGRGWMWIRSTIVSRRKTCVRRRPSLAQYCAELRAATGTTIVPLDIEPIDTVPVSQSLANRDVYPQLRGKPYYFADDFLGWRLSQVAADDERRDAVTDLVESLIAQCPPRLVCYSAECRKGGACYSPTCATRLARVSKESLTIDVLPECLHDLAAGNPRTADGSFSLYDLRCCAPRPYSTASRVPSLCRPAGYQPRRTMTSSPQKQSSTVLKVFDFMGRTSKKRNVFNLQPTQLSRIARVGGVKEVVGFTYNSHHRSMSIEWCGGAPRPCLSINWAVKTWLSDNLAELALHLRLLHAVVRWDDIAAMPPKDLPELTVQIVLPPEQRQQLAYNGQAPQSKTIAVYRVEDNDRITSRKLLRSRPLSGSDGLKLEYLCRITEEPVDPEAAASCRQTDYQPPESSRKSARAASRRAAAAQAQAAMQSQQRQLLTETIEHDVWMSEDDLTLWEIRQYNEVHPRSLNVVGVNTNNTAPQHVHKPSNSSIRTPLQPLAGPPQAPTQMQQQHLPSQPQQQQHRSNLVQSQYRQANVPKPPPPVTQPQIQQEIRVTQTADGKFIVQGLRPGQRLMRMSDGSFKVTTTAVPATTTAPVPMTPTTPASNQGPSHLQAVRRFAPGVRNGQESEMAAKVAASVNAVKMASQQASHPQRMSAPSVATASNTEQRTHASKSSASCQQPYRSVLSSRLQRQLRRATDSLKEMVDIKRNLVESRLKMEVKLEIKRLKAIAAGEDPSKYEQEAAELTRSGTPQIKPNKPPVKSEEKEKKVKQKMKTETTSASTTPSIKPAKKTAVKRKRGSVKSVGQNKANELYCVCKTPYDETLFYIGCDLCGDWFHGSCVGISQNEAVTIESYQCDRCLSNAPADNYDAEVPSEPMYDNAVGDDDVNNNNNEDDMPLSAHASPAKKRKLSAKKEASERKRNTPKSSGRAPKSDKKSASSGKLKSSQRKSKGKTPKSAEQPTTNGDEYEFDGGDGDEEVELAEQSFIEAMAHNSADDGELYCLCKTPYDATEFYIGCERCDDWYHGRCIGLGETEAAEVDDYICDTCRIKESGRNPDDVQRVELGETDRMELLSVMEQIAANKHSVPFHTPVDVKQYPNYLSIVKFPMDFSTINERLMASAYKHFAEFVHDVLLTFSNCRRYNAAGTKYALAADTVERDFVKRIEPLRKKFSVL